MIAEDFYVAPSPIHGMGLFAARTFEAGAYIGTYEGSPTSINGRYVLWVEEGDGWLGRLGTGPLRFLNHSPTPNAAFDCWRLYAIRLIAAHDEITFDYGPDWSGQSGNG